MLDWYHRILFDYFAAKAMQIMIQNNDTQFDEDCEQAYHIANQMMKEREKWTRSR
tara:strand:- start:6187 stop:6351 length:165 start_codon:yes stop_codon:yes gene_type:complete